MSQGNNRSSSSVKRREKMEPPIPNDLIVEIFSRLPGKSVARFRCLSKLWDSMLRRPYFAELFLTRSSARPRLLFLLNEGEDCDEWSIFSSPQPQNLNGKSSLVVAADFHMMIREAVHRNICSYTSGLIYFPDVWVNDDTAPVICNPITGQYIILPELMRYRKSKSILGFDPINKQFKVVAEAYPFCDERDHHKILTLGTGKPRWRSKNHCPEYVESLREGICINGVCYYLVDLSDAPSNVILCVDVRSETFKFIDAECLDYMYNIKLVNHKGRLGGVSMEYDVNALVLTMCVLEDVERQKWSKRVYNLGENSVVDPGYDSIVGVTASGEIVISKKYTSKPFYVSYLNPDRNTLQRVEIKGFDKSNCRVHTFVNHIENLDANDAKQLKPRPAKQGLDTIRKRPKPPKPQKLHPSRDLSGSAPSAKNKQPTILSKNKFELLADIIE